VYSQSSAYIHKDSKNVGYGSTNFYQQADQTYPASKDTGRDEYAKITFRAKTKYPSSAGGDVRKYETLFKLIVSMILRWKSGSSELSEEKILS